MKTGRPFADVLADVKRTHESKRDYLVDTRALAVSTDKAGTLLTIDGLPETELVSTFGMSEHTHGQIRERLGIPADYAKRLRSDEALHGLFDYNVNELFRYKPQRRLVRTLDSNARAFLSDRYQVIDNWDILATCLPEMQELASRHGAVVESCEVTDDKLFVKVTLTGISYSLGKIYEGEYRGLDDVLHPMLIIQNSEVGSGSTRVSPGIYRQVCENGMVIDEAALVQYHVGKQANVKQTRQGREGAYVAELFSDETKQADDRAYLLKIRDVMRAAVTSISFEALVQQFGETKSLSIKKPTAAVEVIRDRYSLTDADGEAIMNALIAGGDLSMFGLVNAVTRTAQGARDYAKATELETIGGKLVSSVSEVHRAIAAASR